MYLFARLQVYNVSYMNKQIATLFFVLGLLLSTVCAQAKAILFNEEAGLNNIEVTAITKDKSGMMWIATKHGLYKYDGNTFSEIAPLKKLFIYTILYDEFRDVVWIGTDMGLQYISCKDGHIIQCTPSSKKNAVMCLALFHSNIIVGFHYKYILQIAPDWSCKVIYHFAQGQLKNNRMQVDRLGNIYARLTKRDDIIKLVAGTEKVAYIPSQRNRSITFLTLISDQLYAGGVNIGIKNLTHAAHAIISFDSLNSVKQDPEYLLDQKDHVLIGYRNFTKIIKIEKKTFKTTDISVNDNNVIGHKRIFCLYEDEFNVIWIGTNKGLIKLIPDKPKPVFEKLLYNEPKKVSTRQIIEDTNGDIYVASYVGFLKYEKRRHTWTNRDKIMYQGKTEPFSLRSLLNVDTSYIYMGSDANYFVRYNKHTQSIESLFYRSEDGMCDTKGSSLALVQDIEGIIWLGSENGLLSFDIVKSKLFCHTNDKYSVGGSAVRFMYMLPGKKQFWVGTDKGAYLVDKYKGTMFYIDERTTPALSGSLINAITTDTKGNIWIATESGGINVLSADLKKIYTIAKEDGLSSNEVYSMQWQDSVRLWISTYNGLNYYHTQTQTIIQYYKSDGITDNEFNQNSSFRANDGKLYFGGINGITSFYPPQLDIHEIPYQVFVSGIHKWEKESKEIVDVHVQADNKIVMYPGDNLLSFSFSVTDYTAPELHTYFYKIEGQHAADWISLGTESTLRLESLTSGEYKLLIKATKGSRGISSTNILTYNLLVKQTFYQTIWFYLLLATGIAALIYFYFLNRLHNQKKLELLRMKIASDLHDEVGSLLTRITMSADRLATRMSRDSETRDKLEGVATLSREANVAMSDVLWAIDSRNDFTGNLTDRMREHAEDLLFPRGVSLSIDFAKIDHQEKLSPEFRQHLFLLFKETINNIIKHSNAQNVQITYKQSKEHCLLKVKNDGVIPNKETVYTGQGLSNIKMRAELLKGTSVIHKTEDSFEVTVLI